MSDSVVRRRTCVAFGPDVSGTITDPVIRFYTDRGETRTIFLAEGVGDVDVDTFLDGLIAENTGDSAFHWFRMSGWMYIVHTRDHDLDVVVNRAAVSFLDNKFINSLFENNTAVEQQFRE